MSIKSQIELLNRIKEKYSLHEYVDGGGLIYLYPNYLYKYSYPWLVRQSANSMFIYIHIISDYKLTPMKGFMDFSSLDSSVKTLNIFDTDAIFNILDRINEENNKIIQEMKQYAVRYKLKTIENDFVK